MRCVGLQGTRRDRRRLLASAPFRGLAVRAAGRPRAAPWADLWRPSVLRQNCFCLSHLERFRLKHGVALSSPPERG